MKNFKIVLKNHETNEIDTEKVKKLTFPEAVSSAYASRSRLGFDWNIVSIKETTN